jgi:hypothetical protein
MNFDKDFILHRMVKCNELSNKIKLEENWNFMIANFISNVFQW